MGDGLVSAIETSGGAVHGGDDIGSVCSLILITPLANVLGTTSLRISPHTCIC